MVFVGGGLKGGPAVATLLGGANDLIANAAKTARFEGKPMSALEILAPHGFAADRFMVVGVGGGKELAEIDFAALGGFTFGKVGAAKDVTIAFEPPEGAWDAATAADFMMGVQLRAYRFEKYKKKKEDEKHGPATVVIGVGDVEAARQPAQARPAPVDGRALAPDRVND